jgi:hypothetical protein
MTINKRADMIDIIPDMIKSLKSIDVSNRHFYCIISENLVGKVRLIDSCLYNDCELKVFDERDAKNIVMSENNDILVIMLGNNIPAIYRKSKFDSEVNKTSRMIVIPLFSTNVDYANLKAYVNTLYITDPEDFDSKVDIFFERLVKTKKINFLNKDKRLVYVSQRKERWLEIGGYAELGKKMVYPCGEVELSPSEFDFSVDFCNQQCLNINGCIAITGPVILNAGYFPFCRESQSYIYQELSEISDANPIYIDVVNGVVSNIHSGKNDDHKGVSILKNLMAIDKRYSVVYEIGIAFNYNISAINGNQFNNELIDFSHNGSGTLHVGLGALNITQYHIDLVSKGTIINFS